MKRLRNATPLERALAAWEGLEDHERAEFDIRASAFTKGRKSALGVQEPERERRKVGRPAGKPTPKPAAATVSSQIPISGEF